MLTEEIQKDAVNRLKKIEGQVRGLQRMVEERKYCVDILLQISAVCGGLKKVGHSVLGNHVKTCVASALSSSSEEDKDKKIQELIEVFDRFMDYK
ncbi:MAG: metal-sensitive transcriptional regulator [Actinomycetota bacterium]